MYLAQILLRYFFFYFNSHATTENYYINSETCIDSSYLFIYLKISNTTIQNP